MAIECFISGVEYRITNNYSIREQAGQSSDASIDVLLMDQSIPLSYQKVELKEDGTSFYLGYIKSVDTPEFSTKYETMIYPLRLASADTVLTRRLVSGAYIDKYVHEIVDELFDEYIAEEGFTLGTISTTDVQYEKYIVPRLKLSDVLEELGNIVGCVARIDCNGVFSFVSRKDLPAVVAPTKITKLKKSENGDKLKSVQVIAGAKAETSTITKSVTWSAGQSDVTLGYQVAEEPAATINANPVAFGLIGVDEGNAAYTFLWRYGNNAVILNTGATVQPSAGDIVVFVFKGFYSIEVVVENEELKSQIATLSGTSGKIESIIVDTSVTSEADGQLSAEGLLRESSERDETLTLTCHDMDASTILNVWSLNYPDLGIVGDYVVVERTIYDRYDEKKINVKLKNKGFYSRYGQVFNKNTKQINNLSVRTDDVVFKQNALVENMTASETWSLTQGTIQYYPGDDIVAPVALELENFYPVL